MTREDRRIRRDRMRYTKNTLSSGLALAAIVFDVLYFVSVYKTDVGNYYYQIMIGASIVYNLVFMLIAFLSSEGVKNYKTGYSFALLVIGALQVARIFILPMKAHEASLVIKDEEIIVMGDAQYRRIVAYLLISAACCVLSGLISLVKNCELASHMASLNKEKAA